MENELKGVNLQAALRQAKRNLAEIEAEDQAAADKEVEARRARSLADKQALAEMRLRQSREREARKVAYEREIAQRERGAWERAIVTEALALIRKAEGWHEVEQLRDDVIKLFRSAGFSRVEWWEDLENLQLAPWRVNLDGHAAGVVTSGGGYQERAMRYYMITVCDHPGLESSDGTRFRESLICVTVLLSRLRKKSVHALIGCIGKRKGKRNKPVCSAGVNG